MFDRAGDPACFQRSRTDAQQIVNRFLALSDPPLTAQEPDMTDDRQTPPAGKQMTPEEARQFTDQVFERARSGDADMLRRLVENGLPPNLRNHKGDTLLMLASYHGHLDASRALLELGADPNIVNDNGQTPLAGAGFKGNVAMAELLIAHGADVNAAGPDGKTALMFAAMFNRTAIVELLLGHGADPAAQDGNGVTALDVAQSMGAQDTPALLAEALAKRGLAS
jgi:ankyrin repeat protein